MFKKTAQLARDGFPYSMKLRAMPINHVGVQRTDCFCQIGGGKLKVVAQGREKLAEQEQEELPVRLWEKWEHLWCADDFQGNMR